MKPTEQPTELNTHNVSEQQPKRLARTRLYAVVRIIDNRLQALAPSDPDDRDSEPDWTDLGGESCIWQDREMAFQIGRANGGLLVSVDGLPGPHRMVAFHSAIRAIREAIGEQGSDDAVRQAANAKAESDAANRAKARSITQKDAATRAKGDPTKDDDVPY